MRTADLIRFTSVALRSYRLRAALTALGIGIGVTAVVLLTSIGEGVRLFVLGQFTQFGTNIVTVAPGKTETFGGSIGSIGNTRPLTIDDAEALMRVPHVLNANPAVQGNVEVEFEARKRRTTAYGGGPGFAKQMRFEIAEGEFLPPDDPRTPRSVAVLGAKLYRELFGTRNALGANIRVGQQRYRVVGIMRPKGTMLGMDLDDTVFIPAAKALELFNREGLFQIDISYEEGAPVAEVVEGIKRILTDRHREEDFTITTQQQMLDTLGSILNVLTFAVGALGSISLLVGGVGIFTIMTIGIRERTAEIGLLRALGAEQQQILLVFLAEAVVLSAVGGVAGLGVGLLIVGALDVAVAALPVSYSPLFIGLAEGLAIAVGLLAGVAPAAAASRMEPVDALRSE